MILSWALAQQGKWGNIERRIPFCVMMPCGSATSPTVRLFYGYDEPVFTSARLALPSEVVRTLRQ